ncbi:Linear gramicidin synthase subunit C [Hypsizygus marmoreus]|uniref:Linear gramicidin synthase subunit C n=1 Tax=Hypsizygus marmoreus TaxID=39966 RepID=A0A369JJ76_HYPMA|nr:Linear gramicidin synthase subunit C [Hypsizygus marmoreus]
MAPKVFKQDLLQALPAADRQLFSHFGLGETVDQPFETVHQAFEHHARQHPYTIAVEDFEKKIAYAELDRQASCLAAHLRSKGVDPGSRVCLLVERSIWLVVGIMGVLKAGGAYVPLDGNVVADKTLNYALKDSGSAIALVQRKFIHRVGEMPVLCLEDTICEDPYSTHCLRPDNLATSSDSCYIIYTSGTTGLPKGVDVMHKNVTNLVCMEPGNLKMKHGTRVSQLMNISFDMAQWEILGSMANGSTLCLRGKTSKEWRAVMKTVDVVIATPSMLAPHEPADNPTIKVVAVAGEPCPKALADKWAKTTAFYNCCGPTEITIVNTMHLHKPGKTLGIGGPTPNNTVYVLDEQMNPVKIGEMGVMWAGGAGITRGYLNLPDKTSEKYMRDPFLADGSMMFNTGDLGRWLPDGDLEHLGRVDHQVKVKGFRVELDGVAAAMETTPGVKVATAILIKGELWGFYAPSSASIDEVKAATAKVQPHYAVPTKYIKLEDFPKTSNGKSDKRALEKLALESLEKPPVPKAKTFKQDVLQHLSERDRDLFTKFGMGKTVKHAFECVHHAFEHHARSNPDMVAVEDFGNNISYAELDRQANCLANRLRASGVAPGSRVCLLVERSILMVVGIVAILKAGAGYVPLDGNVVANKTLDYALKDSGSSLVLVQRKFIHRIGGTPIVCLEESICDSPQSPHCIKPADTAKSTDSAYIIYTSGTTGLPKGVDVMHSNVTNLVCVTPGNLKMGPGVRVSQLMNISFDMAQWEILGSMANGSTLCLRGKTSKEWRAVMKTVDVVIATPSMLAPHDPAEHPNIKVVAVAGEPCPKALADNWAKTSSFYNCCGPTEITIVNTMHLHSPGADLGIGGPTPNNTAYVLDENAKPVKIGEMGVMWAGGAGITRGYLNLPDKTAEKYQLDPFLDDGSYMFNTGDLGRWLPDGDLEHLGRVDHQVKVKGFRVELDGVAAAMETTPGVKVATAILIDSELWGFYAPSNVSIEEVKAATSRVQPHYAIPTKYISLDKFPETANGKSDKRALEKLARDTLLAPAAPAPVQVAVVQTPLVQAPVDPTPIYETPINEKVPVMQEKEVQLASSRASITTVDSGTTVGTNTPTPAATLVSLPLEKKIEASSLEDQTHIWAGYEQDILPKKVHGHYLRNLRYQIFYLYRRLFGIVFIINLGIFISVAVKGANAMYIGQIVVGNLFGAILMRQDYVIDAFFCVFTSVPASWPLWIRATCARVYHIGGLHSGAGASGTLWLILFCVQATKEVIAGTGTTGATLTVTYVVLALLLTLLIFAHPVLRKKFHDNFEATHRFLGWSATALVWVQIILLTNDYRGAVPLGTALLHSAPLWLIVVATISLILPWVRLKKVPVRCEKLSNHAIRMYFNYDTPGGGSFVRLSDSPLTEWHSFATIPEPGKTGFSLVVSRAGDWTIRMIAKPPTHIWKRGIPTYGVMKIAPMFRRIVLVATGSGIGPCTPAILERKLPIRLLWTAPNLRDTFGDKLVDAILEANPEAVIYNTRQHGKPDMVKLTWRLVQEFKAEAVVIISNQALTERVVYGMVSRGIPAFGAIWDS